MDYCHYIFDDNLKFLEFLEWTNFSNNRIFPNLFNNSSVLEYSIPKSSNVIVDVFDILGSEIVILVDEEKPAGSYEVEFTQRRLENRLFQAEFISISFKLEVLWQQRNLF